MRENKIKLRKSQKITKFYQFWYLSFSNFTKNNLWDSACSCSFGFIFSFVPMALIVTTILISVLKVSPNAINLILNYTNQIKDVFDLQPIVDNILGLKSIRFVDIFLAFWVIWMARRLFLSIVRGMSTIFNSHTQRKGLFTQLLTFASEFTMVFIFVTVTLSTFTFRKILESSMLDNSIFAFFREYFPKLFRESSNVIFISVTYLLLFLFTVYIYKFISGTKPSLKTCAFYAAFCIGTFFLFSYILNKFLNISNYNIVYGTISTLILLMVKVYFFFVIFLFCAQMVYVSQFFDDLLLAELYLLPEDDETGFGNNLKRKTFTNSAVLQTDSNTIIFKAGETIFTQGESSPCVYYLHHGEVIETSDNNSIVKTAGAFFGDLSIILNTPRLSTAYAHTDCEVMEISAERFLKLIQEDKNVSVQAISQLTTRPIK